MSGVIVNDKTDLQSLLEQTMVECGLRELLDTYGIARNKLVRVVISSETGIIAGVNIPATSDEVPLKVPFAALADIRDGIKNILNLGQDKFNLVEQIEDHKTLSSLFEVTLYIGAAQAGDVKVPEAKLSLFYGTLSPCGYRKCCTI
jgi:hypothetical protein